MVQNILDYLEATAADCPDKPAFEDLEHSYTFAQVLGNAKRIGSALIHVLPQNAPVPVLMEKEAWTLNVFMGAVCAGCFYTLVEPEQPDERIRTILDTLEAEVIVTSGKLSERVAALGFTGKVLLAEELVESVIDEEALASRRKMACDIDPLYAIFTSGSTGVPKGVVVSHRSVIDFTEHFTRIFGFSREDVIGNQAPFDFDVSVKDIYTSIFTGAKLVLIPKQMFSMPPSLLDFLCEKHVTSLTWAVSALCMVTTLRGFEYRVPSEVRRVLFSGEVMPYKHLKAWREALPAAEFVNLYGPTEIVCNCTYYRVRGDEPEDAALPIGSAFGNRLVFLLDDQNCVIRDAGIQGEICVAGTSLASGYYNNPQATEKSFVQNPENQSYPQVIYRTGDIGTYNDEGLLCFAGRRDFQVKRMGHRIELEEIQLTLDQTEGVTRSCCIYGEQEQKLVAFYVGEIDKKELRRKVKEQMPAFMLPDKFLHMDEMPMTKNGKIDRAALWNHYREEKRR